MNDLKLRNITFQLNLNGVKLESNKFYPCKTAVELIKIVNDWNKPNLENMEHETHVIGAVYFANKTCETSYRIDQYDVNLHLVVGQVNRPFIRVALTNFINNQNVPDFTTYHPTLEFLEDTLTHKIDEVMIPAYVKWFHGIFGINPED